MKMKKIVYIALGLTLASCQPEATEGHNEEISGTNTLDSKELDDLKAENIDLKHQMMVKDSLVNYYSMYINDINSNLLKIQGKQNNIFEHQANPEMLSAENVTLVGDIEQLGALLKSNQSKIAKLKAELANNDVQLGAFENTIIMLSEQVEMKNMEIFQLQQELENVDGAFAELFDAFQENSASLETATNDLNTAYFSLGTKKELLANGVITTEGGVLGLGKNKELADDFNKDYFTQVNIQELKEIPLGFKKVELTTNHPKSSYELVEGDEFEKLIITNAKEFWSVSKYLVIIVK